MYVLDVMVLSKTAPPGVLSYRSAKPHAPGTLISLDLRKRQTLGVVTECVPAMERRAELRSATYTLRGSRDASLGSLPESFMRAAAAIATWHATSVGAVLNVLLADYESKPDGATPHRHVTGAAKRSAFKRETVEASIEERALKYLEAIEAVAKDDGTVLLVVPTLQEVTYWKSRVKKWKQHVTVFAPERSCRVWASAPPTLTIIERAGSGSYVLPKRPYMDVRRAHELLAEHSGARVLYGDYPLPLEYRSKPEAPLITKSITGNSSLTVIDARRDKDAQTDTVWQVFPDEVAARIRTAVESGGTVALLGVRTGYAPAVVCRDCGQAVTDDRGRALSFSQERGERIFRSADGVTKRAADLVCSRCDSWNLQPLGIGVERILEEARKLFSDSPIAYLPSDILSSSPKTSAALAELGDGGLLIGTEAMLPVVLAKYGPQALSLSVIVSADSLLAFPLWRARERFVRLALFTASLAQESIVITRRPEDTALSVLVDQSDPAFFEEESMLRRALKYPPFATLISLNRQGTEAALEKLDPVVQAAVGGVSAITPPDANAAKGMKSRTTIITIRGTGWPDLALAAKLAALPPSVRVRVDPETLW